MYRYISRYVGNVRDRMCDMMNWVEEAGTEKTGTEDKWRRSQHKATGGNMMYEQLYVMAGHGSVMQLQQRLDSAPLRSKQIATSNRT